VIGPSRPSASPPLPRSGREELVVNLFWTSHVHLRDHPELAPELRLNARVLRIDDDESVRRLVTSLLATLGCQVDCAATGAAGLIRARSGSYRKLSMTSRVRRER
jgi:hypothetical protein